MLFEPFLGLADSTVIWLTVGIRQSLVILATCTCTLILAVSVSHMSEHKPAIWLVVPDSELLSQQNQETAWIVPDPLPFLGVGSGHNIKNGDNYRTTPEIRPLPSSITTFYHCFPDSMTACRCICIGTCTVISIGRAVLEILGDRIAILLQTVLWYHGPDY